MSTPSNSSASAVPVVVITGCSSGIGREAARLFAARGFRVYASMRRPEQGGALRDEAARLGWALSTPALDVTSDESVNTALAAVFDETRGRVDILVNNAGYYCFGPVEETSPGELRAQLETNVIGVLRVTRAVLPAMRDARGGAIVNVSSVLGRVVVPLVGPYNASKYALEALTEALRYEVRPFGIRVTCIEPGPFKTDLHTKEVRAAASARPDSPYAGQVSIYEGQSRRMPRGEVGEVAGTIFRAATHPCPRLRWRVGPKSFIGTVLRSLSPDWLYELLVRWTFRRFKT